MSRESEKISLRLHFVCWRKPVFFGAFFGLLWSLVCVAACNLLKWFFIQFDFNIIGSHIIELFGYARTFHSNYYYYSHYVNNNNRERKEEEEEDEEKVRKSARIQCTLVAHFHQMSSFDVHIILMMNNFRLLFESLLVQCHFQLI